MSWRWKLLTLIALLPLRFPGDGVADLHHHPPGSLFGPAHIHLPLHHGPPRPQTSTGYHWPPGSSYGELALCQTSLSDPVNCSNGWCASLWEDPVTAKSCRISISCWYSGQQCEKTTKMAKLCLWWINWYIFMFINKCMAVHYIPHCSVV